MKHGAAVGSLLLVCAFTALAVGQVGIAEVLAWIVVGWSARGIVEILGRVAA